MSRRREAGFSLIEVVLALGIVAAVMISIAGLFVLGGRQVNSGRTASEALAVGRTILEEMQGWGYRQTYLQFGFEGSATSYVADTRTNAFASKWQPALDENLFDSHAEIALESLGPSSPPPTMNGTRAIRVVVTVTWVERNRPRTIRLGTVRM